MPNTKKVITPEMRAMMLLASSYIEVKVSAKTREVSAVHLLNGPIEIPEDVKQIIIEAKRLALNEELDRLFGDD